MTEAMTPAPVDAYPDRQIHYGNIDTSQQSEHAIYDAYAIGYPPAGDYPTQSYQQDGQHYQEAYVEPSASSSSVTPSTPYSPSHPFADPHNTSYGTGFAPPVSFRDPGARGSGYGQSIDSFYGASAADESSMNVFWYPPRSLFWILDSIRFTLTMTKTSFFISSSFLFYSLVAMVIYFLFTMCPLFNFLHDLHLRLFFIFYFS
jgi:hypothetical protein